MNADFLHESTDLVAKVLYARPSSTYDSMAESGAVRTNADWENNQAQSWYIEEQRQGEEAIISGLINEDPVAIEAGLKMFDWGFAQQSTDGGFEGTGDPFHSTSLFVHAVARSLLLIEQSPLAQEYADVVEVYKEKLAAAAGWMIQPEVWERGISNNQPYTHRRYVVATALGLTSQLTGDSELMDYARQSLTDGLALQQPNGVNPELGGHDTSYQMVGVLYAAQWVTYFPEEDLTAEVRGMIDKAVAWEKTRIVADGEVSTRRNTRTSGQEILRNGETKDINNREIIRGLAYWASVTEDPALKEEAYEVARFYYADDLSLRSALYPDDDTLFGSKGEDTIFGGDGDDLIRGGNGDDILDGNAGQDTLKGGNGSDKLDGNSGNDSLYGNRGNDILSGGEGNDTLYGGEGDDILNGDAGNDTLYGDRGQDVLRAGVGNDFLDGGKDHDILSGGEGDDTLYGGEGDDILNGDAGDDTLYGGEGNDTLNGGEGDDFLDGGEDDDILNAGEGDDILDGGEGDDLLNGDAGNDTLYGGRGQDVLRAGVGNDFLDGGEDDDILYAGEGDDILDGGEGNDLLNGDAGNDTLYGGKGDDQLLAGIGDDILCGGEGIDTLTGGAGADTFVLGESSIFHNTNGASDYALLSDFKIAEGDQIQLKGEASDYVLQEFVTIGSEQGTGIYLDDNNNGIFDSADELIALVQGSSTGLNLNDSYYLYV